MTAARTVFVSIGNTDNRLTQQQWADYHAAVDRHMRYLADNRDRRAYVVIHGRWVSPSTDPYQNACWSFTPQTTSWDGEGGGREYTRDLLSEIAATYEQDSVAWAEAVTDFLPGRPQPVGLPPYQPECGDTTDHSGHPMRRRGHAWCSGYCTCGLLLRTHPRHGQPHGAGEHK